MINISDIQTITNHSIALLSLSEKLRREETTKEVFKYAENLFPSLRKLSIASVMQNKRLICISGLQGAGKTSLMKNFYGINDDIMNVSLGRGERVPVLITEDDVSVPKVVAFKIEKGEDDIYSEKHVNLRKDEIIRATTGEDPTIMYLEVTVPYKHTYNRGISFMLLPGFEKKNEFWNDLIEFSVNSSDAAVFVFSETSLSNIDNESYLEKIEQKFGSNVVYAITGSDMSTDDNAQTKRTCIERLNIKEEDRVVCVGQYNDSKKNNEWIVKFKASLDKYALNETQVYQRTDKFIYDELLNVKETLYSISNILNEADVLDFSDNKNHAFLKAFDDAALKKRNELKKNIEAEFTKAKGVSANYFANQLKDTPWYKNLKRTLFGTSVNDLLQTQNMVKSSLNNEGKICLPDMHLGQAIANTIRLIDTPEKNNPNSFQRLVDKTKDENGNMLLEDTNKTKAVFEDVGALIQLPGKIKRPIQTKDHPKDIFKAVAEMTTYYYGLESYNRLAEYQTSGLVYYVPAESNLKSVDVLQGAESSKKFAIGLAGVMGVDILADGSLNLIQQIATSCSIALPYAATVAVAIVGIGAVSAVMKDINRMQRTDLESGKMVINAIYDDIQREALDRFDIYTGLVRERIESNLEDLQGTNKTVIAIYNAKVEVNNLLVLLEEIKESYSKQSHDVGSNFSR